LDQRALAWPTPSAPSSKTCRRGKRWQHDHRRDLRTNDLSGSTVPI
jgi:hypothetical protein